MKNLLYLLLPILACSCEKEEVLVAPPITQVNSFSCKINGELLVAEPWGVMPRKPGIAVIGRNWVVRLMNDDLIELEINLNKNEPDGMLKILKADGDGDYLYDDYNSVEFIIRGKEEYFISHDDTGSIKILEWINDSILVLKFEKLTLYRRNEPTKAITLTEGKLNIDLATLNKD